MVWLLPWGFSLRAAPTCVKAWDGHSVAIYTLTGTRRPEAADSMAAWTMARLLMLS